MPAELEKTCLDVGLVTNDEAQAVRFYEGVLGLKEGGKRLLIIPSDKAYGAAGAPGGKIPPNSALVFEVTLDKIIMQAQ